MPLAEMLAQVARGALAILVASLAIYLSLRLLGKIAKFVIAVIAIAFVIYFVFFATDIAQTVKDAISANLSSLDFFTKGA
jgi:hypothetical protein